MFKIVISYKGKPTLFALYRGTAPVRHARTQRRIYKADRVDVFDRNSALIYTALPRKAARPKPPSKRSQNKQKKAALAEPPQSAETAIGG
jgi:hypothetical protein